MDRSTIIERKGVWASRFEVRQTWHRTKRQSALGSWGAKLLVVWSVSGWELLATLLLLINSGVDDIKAAQNYCHEHDCAGTVG